MMDVYCERTGPGLLAEPLNAISNASFLLAAWAAWSLARRTNTLSRSVKVLIGLAASVGIGSMLWHTFANELTLILDIVPILLFIMWYVWLYSRQVVALAPTFAGAGVVAFLAATYVAMPYADALHGAPVYTPGLLVVVILGVYHVRTQSAEPFTLLIAAGAYFTALFFRTIDEELCHYMPIGTHFVWHSLIGLVTYLAMRALIVSLAARSTTRLGTLRRDQEPSTASR